MASAQTDQYKVRRVAGAIAGLGWLLPWYYLGLVLSLVSVGGHRDGLSLPSVLPWTNSLVRRVRLDGVRNRYHRRHL